MNTVGVSLNQKVIQGQFLGAMGMSGDSSGVHLHFELHKNSRVDRTGVLNPALYIPL